jgi:hypothetical protein
MDRSEAEHIYSIEQPEADCVTTISDLYFAPSNTLVYAISNRTRSVSPSLQNKSVSKELARSWVENLLKRLHRMERWPILVSCPGTEEIKHGDTANGDKHGAYVLTTEYLCRDRNEALLDIRGQIQQLESYSSWNPKCRFVVVLVGRGNDCDAEVTVEEILKELWKWKIINNLVLAKTNSDKNYNLNIYSWFPYQPPSGVCGNMMEIVLLDKWVSNDTSGFLKRNTPLFREKIPNKMSGCPLRVQVAHFPPYVIFQKSYSLFQNVPSIIGLDVKMIGTIAEAMNMSLELTPLYDTYPWGKFINGTWFGLRGGLAYDVTDIALDAWSINLEDYLHFQGTERYFTDRVTWYVPSAQLKPRWMSIARVFATTTWLVIFLSIFVSSAVLWSLAVTLSKFKDSQRYRNIFNCFFDSWAVLLGVSLSEIPFVTSMRLFFISWVIYCLSVSNVFQTFFVSFLVDPGLEDGINNIEELVDSELDIILSVYLSSFFDEKMLRDQNRKTVVDTPYECLQIVADKGNFATMLSRVYFKSTTSEFLERGTQLYLSPFNDDVYGNHIFMLLKKGSCFLDRINDIIFRLVEAGLPAKFVNDVFDTNPQISLSRSLGDMNEGYVSMTVSHLQSAFVLLCLGTVLSIIAFSLEILLSYWEQKRKNRALSKKRNATEKSK